MHVTRLDFMRRVESGHRHLQSFFKNVSIYVINKRGQVIQLLTVESGHMLKIKTVCILDNLSSCCQYSQIVPPAVHSTISSVQYNIASILSPFLYLLHSSIFYTSITFRLVSMYQVLVYLKLSSFKYSGVVFSCAVKLHECTTLHSLSRLFQIAVACFNLPSFHQCLLIA